ncbi:MAG: hypothetical protein IJ153_00080 [Clostridia bacterium]|nr:hypothetical protein [Clostridia bacterium]
MRKIKQEIMGLIIALSMVVGMGGASAQDVLMPDGAHILSLPEEMVFQEPASDESDLRGIFLMPPELEMLVFAYDLPGVSSQTLAEALMAAGREAQVREIGGTEFLVFQDVDEADGAPCVGYSYLTGEQMIEITFFYSSQAAMDLTQSIMESFR